MGKFKFDALAQKGFCLMAYREHPTTGGDERPNAEFEKVAPCLRHAGRCQKGRVDAHRQNVLVEQDLVFGEMAKNRAVRRENACVGRLVETRHGIHAGKLTRKRGVHELAAQGLGDIADGRQKMPHADMEREVGVDFWKTKSAYRKMHRCDLGEPGDGQTQAKAGRKMALADGNEAEQMGARRIGVQVAIKVQKLFNPRIIPQNKNRVRLRGQKLTHDLASLGRGCRQIDLSFGQTFEDAAGKTSSCVRFADIGIEGDVRWMEGKAWRFVFGFRHDEPR